MNLLLVFSREKFCAKSSVKYELAKIMKMLLLGRYSTEMWKAKEGLLVGPVWDGQIKWLHFSSHCKQYKWKSYVKTFRVRLCKIMSNFLMEILDCIWQQLVLVNAEIYLTALVIEDLFSTEFWSQIRLEKKMISSRVYSSYYLNQLIECRYINLIS